MYRYFCRILEEVNVLYPTAKLTVLGDFTLPYAIWNSVSPDCPSCSPKLGSLRSQTLILETISDMIDFLNLKQIDSFLNVNGSLLDLIFINYLDFNLELSDNPRDFDMSDCLRFDFKNSNYSEKNAYLGVIGWPKFLCGVGVVVAVDIFILFRILLVNFSYLQSRLSLLNIHHGLTLN